MQDRSRVALCIAVGLFVLAVLGIVSVVPIRRGYTPQYNSPESIASLEQVSLSGGQQYILIRGKYKQNPILLFLHGGPGMPTMYLAHNFQHDLERDFVVVQWDRRGAGKSYAAGVSAPNLEVSDEINDTVELIDQLRARLHQEKIYLVGFSYGTYLGILVAQRVPDRLHAYVGVGQLACSEEENRKIQDQWLIKQASVADDREALDELTGKKPLDREKLLFKYGGEIHSAHSWWPLLWSGIRSPEYTFQDISNVRKGVQFTAGHLRYDVIDGSILDNVSSLRIPVYFFSGRYDYTDPTICTVRLFDRLVAPIKRMVWFEHSAHFVFLEEPDQFALAMKRAAAETTRWESEQKSH
jgi:pimeloyl-ACP methyl ester carboxylesterase